MQDVWSVLVLKFMFSCQKNLNVSNCKIKKINVKNVILRTYLATHLASKIRKVCFEKSFSTYLPNIFGQATGNMNIISCLLLIELEFSISKQNHQ